MSPLKRFHCVSLFAALCLSVAGGWFGSLRHSKPNSQEPTPSVKSKEKPTFPPPTDIAKDWPKPDVVLFISGEMHGYIEPCGCTGLENQKGGLLRRHTAEKVLIDRGWNLIPIDSGNTIRRFGVQAQIQVDTIYKALNRDFNYDAISISHDDLKTSAIELAGIMTNSTRPEQSQPGANPFISSNLVVLDQQFTQPFIVVERGGKRVGITSVVSDENIAAIPAGQAQSVPAEKGLNTVIPELQKQNCDMLVLIADASLEDSRNLAKQFPVFDVLVTTGGAGDPTLLPEVIKQGDHLTSMIQVGVKGMHVGLVGLFTNPKKEIRYERVPLDARFVDSEAIKINFKDYQDRLKQLYENPANFSDITPRNTPSGYQYSGSESCKECHKSAYLVWEKGVDGNGVGPHFKATQDLTNPGQRVWVKRNFDPECLSCHVTGWNPQEFFPYKTGYLDLNKDVLLHGNGCENCHGPGSNHINIETMNKQAPVAKAVLDNERKDMRVTLKQAQQDLCITCHDLDNSPDFYQQGAFAAYWAKIKHHKDVP